LPIVSKEITSTHAFKEFKKESFYNYFQIHIFPSFVVQQDSEELMNKNRYVMFTWQHNKFLFTRRYCNTCSNFQFFNFSTFIFAWLYL